MRILTALVFAFFAVSAASAQVVTKQSHRLAAAAADALHGDTHPMRVTHISLYKNGIGFFEHEGQVSGDASVRLDLTSAQLNDVLQSLTAVDLGGGRVTGANYNSTTPLVQQLETLPLNLGEQPSQADLFSALRGARVKVTGAGPAFTGRLLSMEIREGEPVKEGEDRDDAPRRRVVTVVGDSGATHTVELGTHVTVRLLDEPLRSDLNTYLEHLNRSRTEGIRHLLLTDRGAGRRTLRVSFLSEVPIWKSTYRLLLTVGPGGAADTATVQGFSVVDNTTGEDWDRVRLSLIAGSPQSFLQPISRPIYDRRPEVPIAANAQTTPQTHESGEGSAPLPPGSASADLTSGAAGNPASLFGSPTGTGSAPTDLVSAATLPKNINMMKDTGPPPPPLPSGTNLAFEAAARDTTEARTTTAAFDDFFAYNLTDPVSIPRNGSALVPILQERLPVESVTLWSQGLAQPLRALWITNGSALTLDRGSFSVVENGMFAGEGLMDPVHPGERRLLSYAVDQAVRVTPETSGDMRRISKLRLAHGVLRTEDIEVADARFRLANAAPDGRTVLLEVTRRPDWTLDPGEAPAEVTPGLYRFRVPLAAHGSAQLSVTQRHTLDQEIRVEDMTEDALVMYLRVNGADPEVIAKLQPVFAARHRVADVDRQIAQTNNRIAAIRDEQKRLRENLGALKGSAEERALVKRYTGELNAQEDTLVALTQQAEVLQQQRAAALNALAEQTDALQID